MTMKTSPNHSTDWKSVVPVNTKSIRRSGIVWVGSFTLLFGAWALFAPLSAAVVAFGSVVSQGQNKLIQHPIGGTIVKIHAKDGEFVEKGASIVTLDGTAVQAEFDRLDSQRIVLKANEARLKALLTRAPALAFPDGFFASGKNGLRGGIGATTISSFHRKLIADQRLEFQSARKRHAQELAGYKQQIRSLETQIIGYQAQHKTSGVQLRLVNGQLNKIRPLARQGYVARSRLIEIEQRFNDLQSNVARANAEIVSSKHRVLEIRRRIDQTIAKEAQENSRQLTRTRGEIFALEKQITAARNTVFKRDIVAPVAGIVTKSLVHTVGGVVRAGITIAEIVPSHGGQLIEAKVLPQDIDYVKKGQPAQVTITAFNNRLYDPVDAVVVYVAADAQADENVEQTYFKVRLRLTEKAASSNRIAQLRAGMQSEIYITTESRTFLSYALKPISDSFRRAFREQ